MTQLRTPIWLLDVDGVINALTDTDEDFENNPWGDLVETRCNPDVIYANAGHSDNGFLITYSPTLIARIRDLHESGRVEVRWLTTWGRGANGDLRAKLGLPAFEVAGEPDLRSGYVPGAPPHHWWKFDDARRVADENPDRALIWTDDDLSRVRDAALWAADTGVIAITPDYRVGLTPTVLDMIEAFIDKEAAVA